MNKLTRGIAVKMIDQVLIFEDRRIEIVFRYQTEYEMAKQFVSIHSQDGRWKEAV